MTQSVVVGAGHSFPELREQSKFSASLRKSSSGSVEVVMPTKCSKRSGAMCNRDDFDITHVLGKGAYGKVFQVRKTTGPDAGEIYAMKVINKSKIADSKTDVRHTRTERDVLVRVDHPFLIKLYYAFETDARLYLVQEYCRGGELFRLLEHERMIMEDSARFYLCQIVCALEYLHHLDVVYRDLKTENIMLDSDGNIKLIDFGLSKIFDDGRTLTQTFCGTVEYMAPEVVIKDPGHGKPADWWSLGIFFFDLVTGRSPFSSNRGKKFVKENILRGKFNIPPYITADAQDLLRKLLRRKVENRLGSVTGASAVRAHKFFSGIDWKCVVDKKYPPPHVPSLNSMDGADVSQFDPRFTSRTPRESECPAQSASGLDIHFADFDYVAPDCPGSRPGESTILPHETDDNNIALNIHELHIRQHGD
jgi:p70 ribosomal S6 kinase